MLSSIIIPVFNRSGRIEKCLYSLLALKAADFEIIVIDDGSTDTTVDKIRSINNSRIRLFKNEKNRGIAYSRNKGILEAKGEFIAFTDSDCEVDPHWLSELIRPFTADHDIMIVGGKIIDPPPQTYWELVNSGTDQINLKEGYVSRIVGCNMAFRKEFLTHHLFELNHADEWDLCLRCSRQNKKIFYTPKALVTHYHRSSFKTTLLQNFSWGNFNVYLNIKNNIFPFLNYGSLLLVLTGSCAVSAQWNASCRHLVPIFFFLYLLLVGYWNTRNRTRSWKGWAITYPGYFLAFSSFCLGNLFFPVLKIKDIDLQKGVKP